MDMSNTNQEAKTRSPGERLFALIERDSITYVIVKRGKYLAGFGSINGIISHRSWTNSKKEAYKTYKSNADCLAHEIGGKVIRVK